jgi:rubrerythrin
MSKMTEENVKSAFAGESQAHMKYMVFADKAEKEDMPNIARLFRAVSYAEVVHASNHLKLLNKVKKTADNLQSAIEGETFEVEEMYPAYIEVAKLQGKTKEEKTMKWALEAEKIHQGMYQKAKQSAEQGKDVELGKVNVCGLCGYTVEGEAPDTCPVCGAKKEYFKEF